MAAPATTPATAPDVHAAAPPASRPRTDWAHLPPIRRSVDPVPPVTFAGERFGRSVAGARPIASPVRSGRDRRSRCAPSGIMLDAARVETIEPATRVQHELPRVVPDGPRPAPVHRRPAVRRTPELDLLTVGDRHAPGFDPPPARQSAVPTRISWTPGEGFADDGEPTTTPTPRFVPATTPRQERAPRATAVLVQDLTGVDVGDTTIDRSPSTSERAAELGAVAFTEAGTVHLPAELGDLDEPRTRAVLAHELTHVAQQRRYRTALPDEASADGRELEAEARAVQHAARRGVRPHVLRRRDHVPSRGAPGVQRLAEDDDPYAWQDRDEEVSPSESWEMTGLLGGYSVRSESAWGRRIARDEQAWAAGFEGRHARQLVTRRNERYAELLEQTLAERREGAADPASVRLGRREVIDVRARIDAEMPFEHGVPAGYAAFPDQLPDPSPDDEAELPGEADVGPDAAEPPHSGVAERPPMARTARTVPASAARSAPGSPHGAPGGRRSTAAGGPAAARSSRPGPSDGASYDWQHREPTEAQTVAALFGGGLLGDLLGRAVGPDTDADRARAERERLPELLEQRQRRERELRHRRLREHLRDRATVDAREEIPEADRDRDPIRLTFDEVTKIREQIDRDLPLEFAVPVYVPADEDAEISRAGNITTIAPGAPTSAEATAPTDGDTTSDATSDTTADTSPGRTPAAGPRTTADAASPASPTAAAADSASPGAADRSGGGVSLGAIAAVGTALDAARGPGDDAGRAGAQDLPAHDREESAASTLLSSASEHDIDALSRRVWSRIRREMRTELLIDRERAGVLADLC